MSDFLNTPQQPMPGARGEGAPPVASQFPSGEGPKAVTTPGGATITYGGKSGWSSTPSGAAIGGAAGGVKIETADGQTIVKGGGAVGATDGTNSAIRGGTVTGVQGEGGGSAVSVRGGYANSSGYRQAGRVSATKGPGGYAAVNVGRAYGAGGTGRAGSATAVRGPSGNTIVRGRGAGFVNGQFIGGQTWRAVNGNFHQWNYYSPAWFARYPGAWWPGNWAVATTTWTTAAWATAGSYSGCAGEPVYYDYSENVTYEDGNVYYGDHPVATAEQYYAEASQIADSGEQPQNADWMPLGVFGIVSEGQSTAEKLVQLAVNKEGVIRGNYHDLLADKVTPVRGAVNKQTQRVAFRLEGNDSVVVEVGLYNLTNDEVPVLVHFDKDRQESRTMVRLQKPGEQGPQ